MTQIQLGDIEIDVELKDIKNIHLSVHPPHGKVTIAAPELMHLDTIRVFALNKLQWIRKQQQAFHDQPREPIREYLPKESHYYLGKRYLLKVLESDDKPQVILRHDTIELHTRPATSYEKKKTLMEEWYRSQLKEILPGLITKWEAIIQVNCDSFSIRKMKTKWGSCNTEKKTILLNLELAKKPLECIEFIVVHELVHLHERKHNDNFVALMDKHLPKWRHIREQLNELPFSYVEWGR